MAQLVAPVSTETEATTPAGRIYPFTFEVSQDEELVVRVDGVIVPPTQWARVGPTVVIAGTYPIAGGATVVVSRNTPIRRDTAFGNEAYARGPAAEVAFARLYRLVEELTAEVNRVGEEAGVTARPRTIVNVRIDEPNNRILFTRADGTEEPVDLPSPIRVGGLPFSQQDKDRYDTVAERVENSLSGAALGATYESLTDRNRFSDAYRRLLDEIPPWALADSPPLPSRLEVKSLYEANADRSPFTPEQAAKLATYPMDGSTLIGAPVARGIVAQTVGRTQAFLVRAIASGFFVSKTGPLTRTNFSFTKDVAVGGFRTLLTAGETVGLQVADATTTPDNYDDVLVAASRLLALTDTVADGDELEPNDPDKGITFTLTRLGVSGTRVVTLGRDAANHLVLAFNETAVYSVDPSLYVAPTQALNTTIDARIADWAEAGSGDELPVAKLPDVFPTKWGKTHTDAEVDTRADDRITARVQQYALLGNAALIPPTKLHRLTADKLPDSFLAPRSSWSTTEGKPGWTDTFDGSYGSLTGREALVTTANLSAQAAGLTGSERIAFGSLRGPFWSLLSDAPPWVGTFGTTWDGTWNGAGRPFQDFPLTDGAAVTNLLDDSSAGDFPASRVRGIPDAARPAVQDWAQVKSGNTDQVIGTAIARLLESVTDPDDKLDPTALSSAFAVTVEDVANATELASINTAVVGLHFAIVTAPFSDAGNTYAADDILLRDTSENHWVKLASMADAAVNLAAVQGGARVRITSSTGSAAIINRAIPIARDPITGQRTAGQAGVMTAQMARDLVDAGDWENRLLPAPARIALDSSPYNTFTGLDRGALVSDTFASGPIVNDFAETDEGKYLIVPAQASPSFTSFATTGVRIDAPYPLPFGRFNIGFDWLDGSTVTRQVLNSRQHGGLSAGAMAAAYRERRGVLVHRTSGGATLWAAFNPNVQAEGLRFWETGRTADQGHYRITDVHGGLSAADIVSSLEWPNMLQGSIGDPSNFEKRPVRIATDDERALGSTQAAVMTVKQVHDTIPVIQENGVTVPGPVRRINFRTN